MENPNKVVEFLLKNAGKYAKAKSERVYLDEFRRSKRALLMQDAELHGYETSAAQERQAYSHPEYIEVLEALKIAVETEEKLRWQMVAAQLKISIFQTESANNRFIEKATL
jgi:hypothetical protein